MSSCSTIRALAFSVVLLLWLLPGCRPEVEGDEAGECGDQMDNDSNGLTDCDDAGCSGAPACAPSSTVDSDDDDSGD
ncbi:MAG TPA: hypothetical protein DIU15_07635, partial [Deltaproteobacteria bacterium]|nr:hypothetical protein [Deltaproteobacteria bacterium]